MEQRPSPTELIRRYLAGEATAEETALVESWYLRELQENDFFPDQGLINSKHAEMRSRIDAVTRKRRPARLWPLITIAASIMLAVFLVGGYFLLHKIHRGAVKTARTLTNPQPGSQSAILLLSNGKKISLNDVVSGNIARQGNSQVIKTADNHIVYQAGKPARGMEYNTLITKAGNFYPLTLADGTIAVLDAGSSIRYPVNFTGNERRVEITGQVYFEVRHNAAMPFRVVVKGHVIEDLGTSFNINAYDDEPNIKATLIEGSMRVNNQVTLKPEQQALITDDGIRVSKTNAEQVIAWKNGLFKFNETPIAEAMRQLARWYNVRVEYPEGIPEIVFNGEVHRSSNVTQVLEILSFSKVHFQIVNTQNGKTILIRP